MKIREMQLFLSLAEEKNITRAAEKNNYTQSSVSHALKTMEQEIGFPLFHRSQKGLVLTENGKSLLPYIRQVLSAHELFEQQAAAIRGIKKGHIVVGSYISPSILWHCLVLTVFIRKSKLKSERAASMILMNGWKTVPLILEFPVKISLKKCIGFR